MLRRIRDGFTFDDVALVPQYNNIPSRTIPSLDTWFTTKTEVGLPFIPANMDTVISAELAEVIIKNGGMPIFHRFTDYETQKEWVTRFRDQCFISCGIGDLDQTLGLLELGAKGVCIDIAHGHSKMMLETIQKIKQKFPEKEVIAGNVCTAMGFQDLANAGADAVKVGVGPGCFSRKSVVYNENGLPMPIWRVVPGMKIQDGTGNAVSVLGVKSRRRETVKVTSSCWPDPFKVTADHLLQTRWKGEQVWRPVESVFADKAPLVMVHRQDIPDKEVDLTQFSTQVHFGTMNETDSSDPKKLTIGYQMGQLVAYCDLFGHFRHLPEIDSFCYVFEISEEETSTELSRLLQENFSWIETVSQNIQITQSYLVQFLRKLSDLTHEGYWSTNFCRGFLETLTRYAPAKTLWKSRHLLHRMIMYLPVQDLFFDHAKKEVSYHSERVDHTLTSLTNGSEQTLVDLEVDSSARQFLVNGLIAHNSACTTRKVTGFGVPQVTAIMECAEVANKLRVPLIADGGIKGSREIAIALAAGASTCMIGNLFAKTLESAAPKMIKVTDSDGVDKFYPLVEYDPKTKLGTDAEGRTGPVLAGYRGQASAEFQKDWKGDLKPGTVPEGVAFKTHCTGTAQQLIDNLMGGVKSAMTYGGAKNIKELQRKAEFIQVYPSYAEESRPRTEQ